MGIKTIIKPRQGGKTTDLLKMSAKTGYPIVAKNISEAKDLKKKAKNMGISIPDCITITQILNKNVKVEAKHVLVDDADYFINYITVKLIGCELAGLTMVTRNDKGHELSIYGEDINEKYGLSED